MVELLALPRLAYRLLAGPADLVGMSGSSAKSGPPARGQVALPLREAALAWCTPQLVADLRAAHAEFAAASGRRVALHPFLTEKDAAYVRFIVLGSGGPAVPAYRKWLAAALQLEADFRQRVASGEIELEGLQVAPMLGLKRQRLQVDWAHHLTFNWLKDEVFVKHTCFDKVTATRCVAGGDVWGAARTKGPHGRPRFPLQQMVAIARSDLGRRHPNRTREAERLCKLFRECHPGQHVPAVSTTLKRIRQIYERAASAASAQ
ncbi:hypothetical protein [Falsiroseomonas sp. E2-1-a20]|uniref:hypothetical protein n=1 Tax=Falsiroseomonas sp. E2-1-a20 TaxID=3239300 RepID=UPI003F346782